jgi:hypothetical protein
LDSFLYPHFATIDSPKTIVFENLVGRISFRIEKNVYLFLMWVINGITSTILPVYTVQGSRPPLLRNSWRDTFSGAFMNHPKQKEDLPVQRLGFILLGRMVESVTESPLRKLPVRIFISH